MHIGGRTVKEMNKIVFLDDVLYALIEKGQKVRRGDIGDWWLLNMKEIREALDTVPIIDLKVMIRPQEDSNKPELQDGTDTNVGDIDTVPTDPREMASKFFSCCDCIHADDSVEICLLRRCVHADDAVKDCYQRRTDADHDKIQGLGSKAKG